MRAGPEWTDDLVVVAPAPRPAKGFQVREKARRMFGRK
jgi:hypothetical protein